MPPHHPAGSTRKSFQRHDQHLAKTLSIDPYGHGSTTVKGGGRAYREVTVAGTFVV
ncbi:hypothetical protein ACO0M4_30155 [Streptomyces sp. RGM 3693]|uniref:hypothetical protein n=1 Tax=Streptomyces sp. RGM 3693 TaxID=3413284 RepID=UPI003D2C6322